MPRFVILEHDHPVLHWDLLVERNGVLCGWRLRSPPRRGETFAAEESAPAPLALRSITRARERRPERG